MLRIKESKPWVFWPSHICDTFPEKPANKILTGETSFVAYIDLTVHKVEGVIGTLFTLLPHYTALDIYEGRLLFTLMDTNKQTKYHDLPFAIFDDVRMRVKLQHSRKEFFKVFINSRLVLDLDISESGFAHEDDPHIIFGAGNFPKNGYNLNYTDLTLNEFYIEQEDEVIAHHKFEEFIYDKSVDITGNCNFMNRL